MKQYIVRPFENGFEFCVYLLGCCTYRKYFDNEFEAELYSQYYQGAC